MALDFESKKGVAIAAGAYVLAFGLIVVTGRTRQPWVVVLSAVLLLLAAVVANATARRIRAGNQLPPHIRVALPIALIVIALALAGYFLKTRSVDGAALFCLCAAFIATGHLVGEIRSWTRWAMIRGLVIVGLCGAGVVLGVQLASSTPSPGLLVAGAAALLSPVGLSLLSQDALESGLVRPWVFGIVGLVAMAGAVLWLPHEGMPTFFGIRAAVVLLVLVLAIAANTQADVILVAVVLALVWTGIPRAVSVDSTLVPAPVTAADVGAGDTVLVALGDSYMSGEGADRFYAGTNDPGVNECRRAPTAYARMIVGKRSEAGFGTRLAFYACSGATGTDLIDRHQYAGEPAEGDAQSQSQQLQALLDTGATVPLVIVSIGGNDAGFSDIGTECLAPGNCVVRGQKWLDELQTVAGKIDRAYTRIRQVAGDVPVLVVPYPQPISPTRCSYSLLEPQEHVFIDGFVQQLDKVVHKAAAEHGFYYLQAVETSMKDAHLRICDTGSEAGQLGVNFIAISDTEGLIDQLGNPKNWIHNSLHPNARGHAELTKVLADWMQRRQHLEAKPDDPGSDIYQVQSLEELMGPTFTTDYCDKPGSAVKGCDLSPGSWALTQVAQFVRGMLVPLFVLVVGCWLVVLALLRASRPRVRRFVDWIDDRLFS